MKFIETIETYIPVARIAAAEIKSSWHQRGGNNSVAVADYDEDVITMAVQAGVFARFNEQIEQLIVATTTSPFLEESSASIVSYALGLDEHISTLDLSQSVTAGLKGISLATNKSLIIASDKRSARPSSILETDLGEASAAILLSEERGIAQIVSTASINDFGYSTFRMQNDAFIHTVDDKFSNGIVVENLSKVANRLLEQAALENQEVTYVILANEQMKIAKVLEKKLNIPVFSLATQKEIGFTGTSMSFILLNEYLLEAKPGETVLVLQNGSGVEGLLLKVTEEVIQWQNNNKKANHEQQINYTDFLRRKNILQKSMIVPYSTPTYIYREKATNIKLMGQKCQCGKITYPLSATCIHCKSLLPLANYPLALSGTIYTFTEDHVFPNQSDLTTMVVVDLEDGVRFYGQLALQSKIQIGQRVQLVFRKLHEGGGYPNYFWKVFPLTEGGR